MTIDHFRRMALEIPTAVEQSHMNHPDFRIAGRIFASLGVPDENWGMVKLTPEQQRTFIKKAPEVFRLSRGAWGIQRVHECLSCFGESEHCEYRSRRCGKKCRLACEEKKEIETAQTVL